MIRRIALHVGALSAFITLAVADEQAVQLSDAEHGSLLSVSERVMEKVMRVWSVVNIARSIAQKDAGSLNDMLLQEHLELFGTLYCAAHMGSLSEGEKGLVHRALQGLLVSHDELCLVQGEDRSSCIRKIMRSVVLLWHKVCQSCRLGAS